MTGHTQAAFERKQKIALAGLIVAGLVVAGRYSQLSHRLESLLGRVDSLGNWGPVVSIVIFVLACMLLVPGGPGKLGGSKRQKSSLEWTLNAFGLLAPVAVTAYIMRIATKALSKRF